MRSNDLGTLPPSLMQPADPGLAGLMDSRRTLVDLDAMGRSFSSFHGAPPFNHCVVDDFLAPDWLDAVVEEFLPYESPRWFQYKNAIENKKALNDWNAFPPRTYRLFNYLNSPEFVDRLSALVGVRLYADSGLHGGGWHCHGQGGNLNPHYDYSIHPKFGLERKINLIIYVSPALQPQHGGHLGLWARAPEGDLPGDLVKEIEPRCNRAVFFDTTQHSWHGMSRPLSQPADVFRQSLAVYYLCEPSPNADPRGRALFAPRAEQVGDAEVEALIKLRAGVGTSGAVYRQS